MGYAQASSSARFDGHFAVPISAAAGANNLSLRVVLLQECRAHQFGSPTVGLWASDGGACSPACSDESFRQTAPVERIASSGSGCGAAVFEVIARTNITAPYELAIPCVMWVEEGYRLERVETETRPSHSLRLSGPLSFVTRRTLTRRVMPHLEAAGQRRATGATADRVAQRPRRHSG